LTSRPAGASFIYRYRTGVKLFNFLFGVFAFALVCKRAFKAQIIYISRLWADFASVRC